MNLFSFWKPGARYDKRGYYHVGEKEPSESIEEGDIVLIVEQTLSETDDYSLVLTKYGLRECLCVPR